jgi:hypothetical protein
MLEHSTTPARSPCPRAPTRTRLATRVRRPARAGRPPGSVAQRRPARRPRTGSPQRAGRAALSVGEAPIAARSVACIPGRVEEHRCARHEPSSPPCPPSSSPPAPPRCRRRARGAAAVRGRRVGDDGADRPLERAGAVGSARRDRRHPGRADPRRGRRDRRRERGDAGEPLRRVPPRRRSRRRQRGRRARRIRGRAARRRLLDRARGLAGARRAPVGVLDGSGRFTAVLSAEVDGDADVRLALGIEGSITVKLME